MRRSEEGKRGGESGRRLRRNGKRDAAGQGTQGKLQREGGESEEGGRMRT